MFKDLRQTAQYASYMKESGWRVERVSGIYIYIKKFPFWNIIKIQRPSVIRKKIANPSGTKSERIINCLLKKYKHSVIHVEPSTIKQYQEFIKLGFKSQSSPFLPTKTIRLDLTKDAGELLIRMHPKTRYNIKHAGKLGVNVEISGNIDRFAKFWQKTSLNWGMFLPETMNIKRIYKAFGNEAKLFLVKEGEDILGGILLISTGDTSYYMYAAYSAKGKRLFAPTILVWEAIKFAKNNKKQIFDFEGIYDERYPLKTWKGFTRFKKSFGGKETEYPGPLFLSKLPFGFIL